MCGPIAFIYQLGLAFDVVNGHGLDNHSAIFFNFNFFKFTEILHLVHYHL